MSTEVSRNSGMPREVLKWLQSLDLSFPAKNIRRDFSNGFLVAEIFSWYYPKDIHMHSYDNGKSLPTKLGNWSQLQRFFQSKKLNVSKEVIDGTIHCKIGAAELLVQCIYTILTNRILTSTESRLRSLKDGMPTVDFSDQLYQIQLPMHARSTASQAIKNNLKITEEITEPNIITNKSKAEMIIQRHLEHRSLERYQDPSRFDIKPSIGELAVRRPPNENKESEGIPIPSGHQVTEENFEKDFERSAIFKQIEVQQMDKSSQMAVRPGSMFTIQSPVLSQ